MHSNQLDPGFEEAIRVLLREATLQEVILVLELIREHLAMQNVTLTSTGRRRPANKRRLGIK